MTPHHIDAVHAGDPLELVGHVWPLEPAGYRWATLTNPGARADSWPDAISAVLEAAGIPATAPCRIDRTRNTPTPERNAQ